MKHFMKMVSLLLLSTVAVFGASVGVAQAKQSRAAIYVMNADGSGKHIVRTFKPQTIRYASGRVKHRPAYPISLTASPNGAKLAFSYTSKHGQGRNIYVMNSNGHRLKRITKDRVRNIEPAWSPDSSQVVWSKVIKNWGFEFPGIAVLYVANAKGTQVRQITGQDVPVADYEAQWLPNGQEIAFDRDTEFSDLPLYNGRATVDLASGQVKELGSLTAGAKWSPDGSRILYTGSCLGCISTANPDGTNKTVIPERKEIGGIHYGLDWSHDGKRISGISQVRCALTRADIEIYTMNVDGTDPQNVSANNCKRPDRRVAPASPAWLNSDQLVFASRSRSGKRANGSLDRWRIYRANFDGSGSKRLATVRGKKIVPPVISRSKKKIFYVSLVKR